MKSTNFEIYQLVVTEALIIAYTYCKWTAQITKQNNNYDSSKMRKREGERSCLRKQAV
jgi:hypothetical protein